ncbi:cytochrome P450 family protein [Nocardiopsis suaedae]|uniref:Cytochrome P450 n=1 Tax=Nocardiopsis suaedae TaxID=3018444 RepID=A0ABT4TDW3_9ACTN|nr:cytochrome P450 [Nocardiopsis suaedae]MDA2802900.1 cytochrome P450 [Nocardiopsis suaedae]
MTATADTGAGGAAAAEVDLTDPRLQSDPHGFFADLHRHGRVVPARFPGVEAPVKLVHRYEDVRTVLSDRRFVNNSDSIAGGDVQNVRVQRLMGLGLTREQARYLVDASILDMDGDDHTRMRKHVSRAFTVKRVNALRPRVEEITDRLLDELPGHAEDGVVDLTAHFAYPLPIIVICELVGVPEEQRMQWGVWGRRLIEAAVTGQQMDALEGLVEQTRALIAERRATPAEDLITALIRTHDEDGDRLSDIELVSIVLTLILAGHETTAHLITNGTLALLDHPDQLRLLKEDPKLGPRATHELMRRHGPIQGTRMRYASEDMEADGMRFERGDVVFAVLGGANTDPDVFSEPDRLDLTREPAGRRESHVGFGHGIHYCLGAALARQEGEIAFTRLFERYPDLSLAVGHEELEREALPLFWRLKALPVRLG